MKGLFEFFRLINRPCRDMTALLSHAMDRQLPLSQRAAYKFHIMYCTACRRYRKQLLGLRAAVRRVIRELTDPEATPLPGPRLSTRARRRIGQALRGG